MPTIARSILGLGAPFWLALTLSGCGEDGERPSEVNTLRVLAVRAETPFTKPGTSVELSMLAHDGSSRARLRDGTMRRNSALWIGGCNNPQGDNYRACMPYLHEVVKQLGDGHLKAGTLPADVPSGTVGWGAQFLAVTPSDIIAQRPTAAGVVFPYATQMVFFADCGGVLRRKPNDSTTFPLGCFDATTGEELGRDDFEFGFYPVFVYDNLENQNPAIEAARFDGQELGGNCSDSAPCSDNLHCGTARSCIPVVPRCKQPDKDDCESYRLAIKVPQSAVERATVAHVTTAEAKNELLWVSYYANAGSFKQDARIINDPNSGWSDDTDGLWRAHVASSREVRLWAVVRDNRNGVAWAVRDVWVD